MGKKSKFKKFRRKKWKLNKNSNSTKQNNNIPQNNNQNIVVNAKSKIDKSLIHKKKALKRKIKRIRQKNKKKYNYQLLDDLDDIFMSQQDLERIPHDKFFTFPIPKTPKENSEYIPLLVSESDIILELLDARDIIHSRNIPIEKLINNYENKILIYTITKSDLVSNEYLEKITIILKNNNNESKKNQVISISSFIREKINDLFILLKKNVDIIKKKKLGKIIKIGIIGPPNVGKNTFIQSLELIINSNCEKKYIYFDEKKEFCVNSVPAILFDEEKENQVFISKRFKNIKEITEPKSLIINLMNVVDKNKLKDIYEFNKVPESLEDFIFLIKEKYELKDDLMSIWKILEDIITGKISYEIDIK